MWASARLRIGTDLSTSDLMASSSGGLAHYATMEFAEVLDRQRVSDFVVDNVCFALSAIDWPPLGGLFVRIIAMVHYLSNLLNRRNLRCHSLGHHSVGDEFVDAAHRSPEPFCSVTGVLAIITKLVRQESGSAGLTIAGDVIWKQVLAFCNDVRRGFARPKTSLLRGSWPSEHSLRWGRH